MAKLAINSEKQATAEDPPQTSSTLMSGSASGSIHIANDDAKYHATDDYPHGARLAAVVLSLMLGMFLVALDNVSPPVSRCITRLTKAINRPSSAQPFPR